MDYLQFTFYAVFFVVLVKLYLKCTHKVCRSNVCLVGKTAIVTGGNAGLGYQTAEDFAKRGAKVIIACRNASRGKEAERKIIENSGNPNVFFKRLDLESFASTREFAEDILKSEDRLDILVNNAGVGITREEKTEDGLLVIMQTNYFGPFLLTNLLLDLMKRTAHSRIVNVSSKLAWCALRFKLSNLNEVPSFLTHFVMYSRTKLCQILFTIELADRLKGTSVTAYSLHPGIISTKIWNDVSWIVKAVWLTYVDYFYQDSYEGAQTTVYCSVARGIEALSGHHFADCAPTFRYWTARDSEMPRKLWKFSEQVVKLNN